MWLPFGERSPERTDLTLAAGEAYGDRRPGEALLSLERFTRGCLEPGTSMETVVGPCTQPVSGERLRVQPHGAFKHVRSAAIVGGACGREDDGRVGRHRCYVLTHRDNRLQFTRVELSEFKGTLVTATRAALSGEQVPAPPM